MTRYTIRIKANIFVVLTTRCYKLINRTDGDGTQSEYNSKRKYQFIADHTMGCDE